MDLIYMREPPEAKEVEILPLKFWSFSARDRLCLLLLVWRRIDFFAFSLLHPSCFTYKESDFLEWKWRLLGTKIIL